MNDNASEDGGPHGQWYRVKAAACFLQAKQTSDVKEAARLLDEAARWIGLATVDFLWRSCTPTAAAAAPGDPAKPN
jgi:hypothetical protein